MYMSFLQYLGVYAISVAIFFAIDIVWLSVVALSFYRNYLGHLLGPVHWPVAIAFYLIFLIGLFIFAIAPALSGRGLMYAIIFGALFGFFTYATYDLTNWATLRNWPWQVVFVDIVWGTALSASVAGLTYLAATAFVIR